MPWWGRRFRLPIRAQLGRFLRPIELPCNHMPAPIFISYARRTSLNEARALKAQLGDLAFLDETEIPSREQFAKVIAKGLMEARLAVVFADDTYFDRPRSEERRVGKE